MTLRLRRSTNEIEGRFFETWALVDTADDLDDWPADAKLTAVGKATPRADGLPRVTGSARYTVDIALPGMLHAAVLRSPLAHARVVSLDLEAASALPGVRAVLGPGEDLRGPKSEPGLPPSAPVLASEVSYAGQAIAAVAADTPEAAAAAIEALSPVLEPLPFVVDLDVALAEQQFSDEPSESARGDADEALGRSDVQVEVAISTPGHQQVPLETHAAVADWRPEGLTVWLSTQSMFGARSELARIFDLHADQVRVVSEFVGGGFGGKVGAGVESVIAVELSRRARRPVRLVNDRHAEQLDGGRRPSTQQRVRIGATREGRLLAIDADAIVGMGGSSFIGDFMAKRVLLPAEILYACETVSTRTFPALLNLRSANAFRAPGIMEGTTVLEQAIDELASALGRDPLDLRRQLHTDHDQPSGLPYSGKQLLACYDRAAELARWTERDRLREAQSDGLLRGMGCASQIWWGSGGPPAHATIRVTGDGTATVTTGIQDTGTGTTTVARLVAAEELGLPIESVVVLAGDTARGVYGGAAGGSMTTPSVAPAVRSAAAKAYKLLLQLAGDVLEIAADDLTMSGGRIRSNDGAIDIPVTDVTGKLGNAAVETTGSRGPNPDDVRVQTFGCQIAQVAVDAATGEVVVERIWAVHDVGRIVNPLTATSQVEGGIIQGVGFALSEELIIDPTTGVPVNATLDDYKVPTISDAPDMVIDFVGIPDPGVPNTGAKGLGEPPIIPTAAAIANAFAHATGRRAAALPLTRARVFEALR